MRLTTRTNLASRILMACAVNDGVTVRTSQIAARCNASTHHMLQVVNLLHGNRFVETIRGRSGGLRLARPMDQISIGEVFRVFEAGVPFAECFDAQTNTCPLSDTCRLRSFISRALEMFYHELDMTAPWQRQMPFLPFILLLETNQSSTSTEASEGVAMSSKHLRLALMQCWWDARHFTEPPPPANRAPSGHSRYSTMN